MRRRRRDAGQADPIWLKSSLVPAYYESGFHYQTDGWMSAKSGAGAGWGLGLGCVAAATSCMLTATCFLPTHPPTPPAAKVYETSTETLFVGRQDAMQRCTLVPLRDFMAGKDAGSLLALEVAAGTGRFATFVKDNYPGLQVGGTGKLLAVSAPALVHTGQAASPLGGASSPLPPHLSPPRPPCAADRV